MCVDQVAHVPGPLVGVSCCRLAVLGLCRTACRGRLRVRVHTSVVRGAADDHSWVCTLDTPQGVQDRAASRGQALVYIKCGVPRRN